MDRQTFVQIVGLEGTIYCGYCGTKLQPDDMSSPSAAQTEAEAMQPVEKAKLVVTATDKEYLINKDITLIGRESVPDSIFPEIDLTPDDPDGYISRRHTQIQRQDKRYTIVDLNSTNGTFVNNKRLAKNAPYPLTNGDEIRAGKIVLRFLLENPNKDSEEIKNSVDKKHRRTSKGN